MGLGIGLGDGEGEGLGLGEGVAVGVGVGLGGGIFVLHGLPFKLKAVGAGLLPLKLAVKPIAAVAPFVRVAFQLALLASTVGPAWLNLLFHKLLTV